MLKSNLSRFDFSSIAPFELFPVENCEDENTALLKDVASLILKNMSQDISNTNVFIASHANLFSQ